MKKLLTLALSLALTAAVGVASANTKLVVGASATPHAEILEAAKPILAEKGIDLEIVVFDDYVQPNLQLEAGDLDANYFQHIPYLENFNEEQGTHLVNAGGIHYEPFGIYPGTKSSLDDIAEGDTIAVPNDTTNEARALLLLQDNGILKLKDGAGLTATVLDIEENPYNVEILELEAAQVPRVKDEVAFVVLNGNYALDAGFSVAKDSLAYEKSDSDAAKTYVNVIAVKEGNENSEKIQALPRSSPIPSVSTSTIPMTAQSFPLTTDFYAQSVQDFLLRSVSMSKKSYPDHVPGRNEEFDETGHSIRAY